nr:unnamed protein product [Spirometra erinaceieuropaei]
MYVDDAARDLDYEVAMFADDMKIWSVIRGPADEDRLQMNLNRLEEWSNRWLLRFNVAKCSILRLGNTARSASTRGYFLGGAALQEVEAQKDLGVLTTSSLKPSAHCSRVAKTAMSVLGLANYKHKEAARTDIEAAARTYPSLPVKFQSFTFDDGTTCDLLSLDGTLPVTYDRRTYNIPVAIFFLSAHPHMPPMVYVRPTSSMEIKKGKNVDIKKGKNVDVSGRVYLPYLSNWKHPQSNTIQLLHLLSEAFGQNPPVYSKQPACPSPPTGSVGPPSVGFQTYPATQGRLLLRLRALYWRMLNLKRVLNAWTVSNMLKTLPPQ